MYNNSTVKNIINLTENRKGENMNSIVRFLKNKNTVTVIGVILIIAILWGGYYYQLQKQ